MNTQELNDTTLVIELGKTLETEVNDYTACVRSLIANFKQKDLQVAALNADINHLRRRLADTQIDTTKQINDAIAEACAALRVKHNSEIATLKRELAASNAIRTALDRHITSMAEEILQLQTQLNTKKTDSN